MIMNIAKEFRWEMGHRLPYHDGGCRNVHGHSYRMRVEVEGEVDEKGMVIDYFDIKAIVQPIIDRLDHSFMCDESDAVMCDFFKSNDLKVNYVPFPTTAENIALYLLQQVQPKLEPQGRLRTIKIRLRETERTFAEVAVAVNK